MQQFRDKGVRLLSGYFWGKQSSQPFHSKNVPDLCTIDSSLQRRELGPEILVQKITIFEGGGGLFRAPQVLDLLIWWYY